MRVLLVICPDWIFPPFKRMMPPPDSSASLFEYSMPVPPISISASFSSLAGVGLPVLSSCACSPNALPRPKVSPVPPKLAPNTDTTGCPGSSPSEKSVRDAPATAAMLTL